MLNISRPPYSMLGYNRTITPTNIRFAQHWARGGGGRKKKEVKTATFPTLLTMIVVSGCFTGSCFKNFFSRFWSPSRTGQVLMLRTRVFFRGLNILDEGEEGGGSLQGHHQLACVQTLPPPPLRKKMRFFFEEGGGGRLYPQASSSWPCYSEPASQTALFDWQVQLQCRQLGKTGAFHFRFQILGKLIQEIFQVKWNIFFLRLEPRFCWRFIIRWKLCNFALKAFTFFKKRSIYWK